jgi:hypothetical protein
MHLNEALASPFVVLAVMGPFAGEAVEAIIERKEREVRECGFTLWHHQSWVAPPDRVQAAGRQSVRRGARLFMVLTKTATGGQGLDTRKTDRALQFAVTPTGAPRPIPRGIYVERGRRPFALWLTSLVKVSGVVDLWSYSQFDNQDLPVKSGRGSSTFCAIKKPVSISTPGLMKSRFREVVAIAQISEPYSVWLR